ncbi:MAG TPA: hypothetical protein D7I00_00875 [Candidatus Poseidoniales archaeon]|nr:MAG TPA: hypothetical protein D7I00_00875 [Candidatus Poseidoniales archaeon]
MWTQRYGVGFLLSPMDTCSYNQLTVNFGMASLIRTAGMLLNGLKLNHWNRSLQPERPMDGGCWESKDTLIT